MLKFSFIPHLLNVNIWNIQNYVFSSLLCWSQIEVCTDDVSRQNLVPSLQVLRVLLRGVDASLR